MHTRMALAVTVLILLAGCTGPAPEPATDLDDGPVGASEATDEPGTSLANNGTEDATELPETVPVSATFDGRLEHGARVCRPSTGECHEVRPVADDQEVFIPIPSGTLIAGNATLSWNPTTDLTEEMRLTVFWVPECADCDIVFIGGTIASGPIVAAFDVPLEVDGGSIWAYARAPYANRVEDVYVQNDFQQAFTIDVEALVQPAGPA